MLHTRQLIPPLTLRKSTGQVVHAWDFKQKRNLIIAFLDAHCASCQAFIRALVSHAIELHENEAVALLVFAEGLDPSLCDSMPAEIIAGLDIGGKGTREFLGADALSSKGLGRRAVFITDRYGEVAAQWITAGHEFPLSEQILSSLERVEIACEECGLAHWPVDE